MAKLALWFTEQGDVTLEKSLFFHPLLEAEIRAVRGKTSGAYRGFSTFQWTPAVQSMALLMLRTAALPNDTMGERSAVLEGYSNSPASSLDYSVGKCPCWMLDVFGVDSNGNPLAKKLFKRTNPERKRKGPCAVSINQSMLKSSDINIFINGKAIADHTYLSSVADIIEECFHKQRQGNQKKTASAINKKRNESITKSPILDTDSSSINLLCPCCGKALNLLVESNMAA